MKKPIKILLITCMYNRPLVSRLFAMSMKRLQAYDLKRFEIKCIAAVSDRASMKVCQEFGIDAYLYHNNPVGKKHNSLIEKALEYSWTWDYILQLGDDDVMGCELLDAYDKLGLFGYDYFGVNSIYFLDSQTRKCTTYAYPMVNKMMGAGRMISRSAISKAAVVVAVRMTKTIRYRHIEYFTGNVYTLPKLMAAYFVSMNWCSQDFEASYQLWENHLDKGLDNSSELTLLHAGFEPVVVNLTDTPLITDVKSAQNIWQQSDFPGKSVSLEEATWFWSKDEIDFLKTRVIPSSPKAFEFLT